MAKTSMIFFDHNTCTDFEAASSREWLEANGIGGFASGTISGANTRRYHGLLTSATDLPLGRVTIISKIEETLHIDDGSYDLSTNQFPGIVQPQGFKFLKSFRLDPFPIWIYRKGDVELEKRVFMPHGENSVVVKYVLNSARGRNAANIRLDIRPLLSFVDYHHLQHETDEFATDTRISNGLVSIRPFVDHPRLDFLHNAEHVENTGHWYRNFEYSIEKERGFDFHEDLFQPFSLTFALSKPATLIAGTGSNRGNASQLEHSEIRRRKKLIEKAKAPDEFTKDLVLAADQFIVKRGHGHTIIAGYPWFSDWGRDTMIALPGLTLATGRPEIARDIILEFSKHVSQGMLPNRFPDAGNNAEYNTIDATLWYFEAIRAYAAQTTDFDFVREELYSKLADIVGWHLRGTRYNIHVDTDGLLYAGEPG
ncbi:MAG: glycogen debranching enzyme N-terminal domain-containing protein, partial [Pyrinomonadaceae bacterium]